MSVERIGSTPAELLSDSWALIQTSTAYKTWKRDNPGEATKLTAYWAAGGDPPVLATKLGRALALEAEALWESLYLFRDEFNLAAGTPPDPSQWWATPWASTSGDDLECAYDASLAFHDGQGNLVLRCTPGPVNGRAYGSARIQTFVEGAWPPAKVKAALEPPFRIEASIRFARGAGLWGAFWMISNTTSAPHLEVDVQEYRGAYPRQVAVHTHGIHEDADAYDTGLNLADAYNRYWAEYRPKSVLFGVNNMPIGTPVPLPSSPPQMIRLTHQVGVPGQWGGAGGPPPADALPADMLVDYIRAWRIT